ncbi:MAG: hypothetical protein JKY65_20570 [Planctomycetes bacterium]|nr:hypothetical protein [Planctomycetota bacterium]
MTRSSSLLAFLLLAATAPGQAGPQKPEKVFEAKDKVHAVCFDPAGERLALGLGAGTIQLLGPSLSEQGALRGHKKAVTALDWGAGGRLCSGSRDGTARVWKLGKRTPKKASATVRFTGVEHCALGPKGKLLLTGGAKGDPALRLWKTSRGKPAKTFKGALGVTSVAWGPKGKLVASGHTDGKVRLWTARGKPRGVLAGHGKQSPVQALAFDPRGGLLASAAEDGSAILWNLRKSKGKELARLAPGGSAVRALAYGKGGAASASRWAMPAASSTSTPTLGRSRARSAVTATTSRPWRGRPTARRWPVRARREPSSFGAPKARSYRS